MLFRSEALEEELLRTRYKLRSAVEELETTNEELKSSNEEMMSMNEELQSTNEELSTVNDELKIKVEQLTIANADLRNFHESTELAVVVAWPGSVILPKLRKNCSQRPRERPPRKKSFSPFTAWENFFPIARTAKM